MGGFLSAFEKSVRRNFGGDLVGLIKDIDRRVLMLDLEGVVGPKLSDLPPGKMIARKLREYVSGRISIEEEGGALESEFLRLSKKYGTDALLYALRWEYGITYQDVIKEVYMPELNRLEQYLTPDKELRELLKRARDIGKEIVLLSNSNSAVVDAMLSGLELSSLFDSVITVEMFDKRLRPKPYPEAYDLALVHRGLAGRYADALYVDDRKDNLLAPHGMGIKTILVSADSQSERWIDHRVDDLTSLLRVVTTI